MRKRHIPQRTCVVCRQVFPKRELVRVVRTPEGKVIIDESGKQAGRGAYLCGQTSCWEGAIKGTQLEHALRTTLSADDKQGLAEYLAVHRAPSTTPEDSTNRQEEHR